MRLILHIGRPKTASSTIQRFISDATPILKNREYYVPNFLGRENQRLISTLAKYGTGKDDTTFLRRNLRTKSERDLFVNRTENKLQNWLKSLPSESTVIISCEQLSSCNSKQVEWLHDFLSKYFKETRIVVYVRRQDLTFVSRYNTSILSNGESFYSKKFSFPSKPPENLFYKKLINRWAKTFGKKSIHLRRLDARHLENKSVPFDFCSAAGIDPKGLPTEIETQNKSVPLATLEFVRQINERLRMEEISDYEAARIARITHNIGKMSSFNGTRIKPERAQARAFLEFFQKENDELAQEYLRESTLFSDDFSMYPQHPSHIENEDVLKAAVEFVAALLMQPQIRY